MCIINKDSNYICRIISPFLCASRAGLPLNQPEVKNNTPLQTWIIKCHFSQLPGNVQINFYHAKTLHNLRHFCLLHIVISLAPEIAELNPISSKLIKILNTLVGLFYPLRMAPTLSFFICYYFIYAFTLLNPKGIGSMVYKTYLNFFGEKVKYLYGLRSEHHMTAHLCMSSLSSVAFVKWG